VYVSNIVPHFRNDEELRMIVWKLTLSQFLGKELKETGKLRSQWSNSSLPHYTPHIGTKVRK
jgi:hypothetical protein